MASTWMKPGGTPCGGAGSAQCDSALTFPWKATAWAAQRFSACPGGRLTGWAALSEVFWSIKTTLRRGVRAGVCGCELVPLTNQGKADVGRAGSAPGFERGDTLIHRHLVLEFEGAQALHCRLEDEARADSSATSETSRPATDQSAAVLQ